MKLPKRLQPYFPSYKLSDLDGEVDKRLIITNVLNFGDTQDTAWLFKTYQKPDITGVIENPSRGSWTRTALNYWQLILGVTAERGKAERAIMDATPRPETYSTIFS